jgi:uroporphyrin-III C-methyltransferase
MLKCGARGSLLSVAQAMGAIELLTSRIKGFRAKLLTFTTPGDRDLSTPIEKSAPDFFTRDLDEAVRTCAIDFAIHSAKDLPSPMAEDLDWFWLPESADPRDCWVMRAEASRRRTRLIGVSSARREAYARRCCPKAKLLPLRGAVDARLAQVAEGRFDAALMAMAGLKRLFPNWHEGELLPVSAGNVSLKVVPISLAELPPPEGQGVLAVVFKKGDARMTTVRRAFVKAVRFTSAGVGEAGLMTVRGVRDLQEADVVLADELSGVSRSSFACAARWVDVGKRCGAHSMTQDEITRLICDEARKGRRVVRLKGGDAGLFGRLAEETAALEALGIPYLVRPGVSALVAATAPNGLLLTKRGEARGFAVSTPRATGTKTPQVFFMATRLAREVLKAFPPDTPYAMVWEAGGPYERVETGRCGRPRLHPDGAPGLLVVDAAGALLVRRHILLTCSDAVMARATCHFEDCGWRTVEWSMIELKAREKVAPLLEGIERFDAIVLTSPSSARIFFELWRGDRRRLPQFWTCGAGTDAELRRQGVASDILPARDFSAKGLIARLKQEGAELKGLRVLRLRSAKAGRSVAAAIRRQGASVEDVVLYDNVPVRREGCPLPPCDAVFFASASAVEAFLDQYGAKALARKELYVMGEPTRRTLVKARISPARCKITPII